MPLIMTFPSLLDCNEEYEMSHKNCEYVIIEMHYYIIYINDQRFLIANRYKWHRKVLVVYLRQAFGQVDR